MGIYGKKSCEGCEMWGRERAHDDDMPLGSCRAHPPTHGKVQALAYHDPGRPTEPGPIIHRAEWPWTAIDDWCGGFIERQPETEK